MPVIFDGDCIPQRHGTNSVKWDGAETTFGDSKLLPMWVADMDFRSPPCVTEALRKAVDFGIYGYYSPPLSYLQTFIGWEKRHHNVDLQKEWLRFTPGVVPGIYSCIQTLTRPGDACIILTPCYYPFMNAILDSDRKLVTSDLKNTDGIYTIDFDDFERKIRSEQVRLFLLCSPHNPVGRVWSREELLRLAEICMKHDVYIISDEIHQDITFGPCHISSLRFPKYYKRLIMLTSASKTFNLAGCQNSFAVIPDPDIRDAFDAYVKRMQVSRGVLFGYIAAEAAFRGGDRWLKDALAYIGNNYQFLKQTVTEAFPEIRISPLEGTYLCWVDLGAYILPADIRHVVQNDARLAVDYGNWFWPETYPPDSHIRINMATSRSNVQKAAVLLKEAIRHYVSDQKSIST